MDSSEVILNKVLQANEKHRFAPPSFLEFRKKEIDIVTSLYKLKKVPLILEIGGGLPIQAAMLSRFSERFLCLDLLQSTGIWNTDVEKRVKLIEAACAREVILVYGDAQYIPLLNDSVDVIYSSNVLEHIDKRVEFLQSIKELAPKLLIRVPAINRDWITYYKKELKVEWRLDSTHFTEYTADSLVNEFEKVGLSLTETNIKFGEFWVVAE